MTVPVTDEYFITAHLSQVAGGNKVDEAEVSVPKFLGGGVVCVVEGGAVVWRVLATNKQTGWCEPQWELFRRPVYRRLSPKSVVTVDF